MRIGDKVSKCNSMMCCEMTLFTLVRGNLFIKQNLVMLFRVLGWYHSRTVPCVFFVYGYQYWNYDLKNILKNTYVHVCIKY